MAELDVQSPLGEKGLHKGAMQQQTSCNSEPWNKHTGNNKKPGFSLSEKELVKTGGKNEKEPCIWIRTGVTGVNIRVSINLSANVYKCINSSSGSVH